jgi:hypothetical protein
MGVNPLYLPTGNPKKNHHTIVHDPNHTPELKGSQMQDG